MMTHESGFENEVEFEKWVTSVENRMFKKDRFKEMGKENDFIFQTLVFMGNASQQMSLAYTIASELEDVPKSIKDEMRETSILYHELQDKIRNLQG